MAMVDPKARAEERKEKGWSEDGGGSSTRFLKVAGYFNMAACGFERFKSSGKGTPAILVRLVVVEGPNAGEVIDAEFWNTPGALFKLADFAGAFGYMDPFDSDDDDTIDAILTYGDGVISVKVESEGYQKNDGSVGYKFKPTFYNKYKGKGTMDTWQEHIQAGEESFGKYLKWRAKNPRKAPGQQASQQGQQDDGSDIPF